MSVSQMNSWNSKGGAFISNCMRHTAAIGTALGVLISASQLSVAQIATSALDAKPLGVGDRAPNAHLMSIEGKDVRLKQILKKGPTVLIFYRGGWCPYCNAHLADLQNIQPDLQKLGYQIVAVSPDLPGELRKTMDKHSLGYQLVCDTQTEAMRGFHVAYRLDDPTYNVMKSKYGVDLESYSGKAHHVLPVPSVYIIDRKGKILFAHTDPNYKVRMKGDEVLAAAKAAL